MPKIFPLASGQIAPHHTIEVRYEQDIGEPAVVRIIWPDQPTVVPSVKIAEVAATACRVLANACTEMSRMKAGTRR